MGWSRSGTGATHDPIWCWCAVVETDDRDGVVDFLPTLTAVQHASCVLHENRLVCLYCGQDGRHPHGRFDLRANFFNASEKRSGGGLRAWRELLDTMEIVAMCWWWWPLWWRCGECTGFCGGDVMVLVGHVFINNCQLLTLMRVRMKMRMGGGGGCLPRPRPGEGARLSTHSWKSSDGTLPCCTTPLASGSR
jgi:hypothetical protein